MLRNVGPRKVCKRTFQRETKYKNNKPNYNELAHQNRNKLPLARNLLLEAAARPVAAASALVRKQKQLS